MEERFKLEFSNIEICGRSQELKQLRDALRECACRDSTNNESATKRHQVVMIEGASGTGKSALVNDFGASLNRTDYVLCRGKFDEGLEISAVKPFSAIVDCVDDIADRIANESNADQLKSRFEKAMGPELLVLAKVSAQVKKVFFATRQQRQKERPRMDSFSSVGQQPEQQLIRLESPVRASAAARGDTESVGSGMTSIATTLRGPASQWGFERLRLAFRSFIRTVCSFRPVIFAVDDLQWVDEGSLSVIKTLFNDAQARRFLFVGTHRPVGPDHALSLLWKSELPARSKLTRIEVGSLSEDCVCDVLSSLLRRDKEDTKLLGQVVHRKTGGNAFTVVQFMSLLHQKGLIFYSLSQLRWEWDVDRIISATDVASSSVLDILTEKFSAIPRDLQDALSSAAFLGPSRFNIEILSHTMIGFEDNAQGSGAGHYILEPVAPASLEKILSRGVEEGLLDDLGKYNYKFSHDRIKECACNLLPSREKEAKPMHLSVGRELRQMADMVALSGADEDIDDHSNLLLLAVHHLNLGAELIVDPNEKADLAKLNDEAAGIALEMSSIFPAVELLETGLNLLGGSESRWSEHYDLTLKMTSTLAQVCFYCDLVEESNAAINDVLSHACCLLDKLPVFKTQVVSLTRKGNLSEAMKAVLFVLHNIGRPLPGRFLKFHIALRAVEMKWLLHSLSHEEMLSRAEETNPLFYECGEFVFLLADICISTADIDMMCLCMVNGACDSLRRGRTRHTPVGVAACALVHIALHEYDCAATYANLALKMANENRYPSEDARAILTVYGLVAHWNRPYHDCLEPVLQSLKVLIDTSNIEYVFLAMLMYSLLYFMAGLALEPIMKDLWGFIELLEDYGQTGSLKLIRPHVQLILNLMGHSDDPLILTGEAMDEGDYIRDLIDSVDNRPWEAVYFSRMVLGYYFDNLALADEMSRKLLGVMRPGDINPLTGMFPFFHGLVAASLARVTGKWRYRRRGRKFARRMKKFVVAGNVNCFHMLKIMEAELLPLKEDTTVVQKAYDEAIVVAARHGFLHHHALANERAGIYFLSMQDKEWAATYLRRAWELYRSWNATAKVDHMIEKYGNLLGSTSQLSIVRSSGIRGRSRIKDFERNSSSLSTESLVLTLGARN